MENANGLEVRGCTEGQGSNLVVQLVNNRAFGMVLTYGGPISFGWHEPGDSVLDKQEYKLADALVGSKALYLPPRGRASIGIRQPNSHNGENFYIGVSPATLGLDLFRAVGDDVLEMLPGNAIYKLAATCAPVLSESAPLDKLKDIGTLREQMSTAADCFKDVLPELVRDRLLDQAKATKLANTLDVLKKASLVGRILKAYSVEWNILDLYADTHWVAPITSDLGWGFAVYARHPALAAPTIASVASLTPGTGQPHSTSGIVKYDGKYWFAVAEQGDPSDDVSVKVYQWSGSRWGKQADIALIDSDGTRASGGLSPPEPLTIGRLTGANDPDFLIHSTGADTNWLSVVSDVSGTWAAVPFDDTAGRTLGEAIDSVEGRVITVSYNSCNPSCATAKPTTVAFRYASASFKPLDPPGSCSGEALASAAHSAVASSESGSHASYAITGFVCKNGYAAALATNYQTGWSISFRSTGNGWRQLDLDNILPPTGIPSSTYMVLRTALGRSAQDQYFPY